MLLIVCPNCGPRDETDLVWGGEEYVMRPNDPNASPDAEWTAYLYQRMNRKGPSQEWWYCRFGCHSWFTVCRDTATDFVCSAESGDEGAEP